VGCTVGWDTALQDVTSRGSIYDGIIGIFRWISYQTHNGSGVDSATNINEYQRYLLGYKDSRCVKLTTLLPSYIDCIEVLGISSHCISKGLNWQTYETRSIQCCTVPFKQMKVSSQKYVTSSYIYRDKGTKLYKMPWISRLDKRNTVTRPTNSEHSVLVQSLSAAANNAVLVLYTPSCILSRYIFVLYCIYV
jgi:hypothetical protein